MTIPVPSPTPISGPEPEIVELESGNCSRCDQLLPLFALSEQDDGMVCGNCLMADAREAQIAAEAAAPQPEGWASDLGVWLKAERSRRLDAQRWTVMPDSPLTDACRAAWLEWLRSLQRMTLDCADPADWLWPDEPGFQYGEEE